MVQKRHIVRTLALLGWFSTSAALASLGGCGDDGSAASPTSGGTGGAGGVGGAGGSGGAPIDTWRLDRSKPFSSSTPTFAEVAHTSVPTGLWGNLAGPLPTNATWMNFVLGQGDQRSNVSPYDIKALAQGLSIARPAPSIQSAAIVTPDVSQLRLSATQAFAGHVVKAFDLLSVTLEWTAPGGTMTAPIVYGMPYVTARYAGLPPSVSPGDGAILMVNGAAAGPASGQRFEVSLNNGQTWVVYASAAITFQWNALGMTADAPYNGTLRVALRSTPAAAAALDAHAAVIPTGGDIEASIAGDTATVRFAWKTEGQGDLLMMALPHHLDRLDSPKLVDVSYPTVTGEMKAVSAASWTLTYPLSTIAWDAPRPVDPAHLADVEAALAADKAFVPSATTVDADPYLGGKQLAKLARLIQIAEALGQADVATQLRGRLKPFLSAWLDGQNSNPLVYDKTWGGLVTTKGVADPGADFGQGYYNDHHFHYGYFLYAAAVLARGDKAWRDDYTEKALSLARDIANPSDKDPKFTSFRHMDWFTGHSWGSGLFAFGDGRNQESTSEAVNAWYSLQLLGDALGSVDIENLGRLLLALETTSAQAYWQVPADSDVYPPPFKDNHAVGVLWSTKADFTTSFGAGPAYVYGIQMRPFTPIAESLVSPAWITAAWPQMEAAAATASDGWRGFLFMAHATIDKDAAWTKLTMLTDYDDGNSKTATLYWAATRP